jgi:hypothetical protein
LACVEVYTSREAKVLKPCPLWKFKLLDSPRLSQTVNIANVHHFDCYVIHFTCLS